MTVPEECDGVMCPKCAPNGCTIPDAELPIQAKEAASTSMREAWENNTECALLTARIAPSESEIERVRASAENDPFWIEYNERHYASMRVLAELPDTPPAGWMH